MSPHRTPGEVEPDPPAPLKKGPAKACKGCGATHILARLDIANPREGVYRWVDVGRHERSPLPEPRACTPARRVQVGTRKAPRTVRFLWFWTHTVFVDEPVHCSEPGEHLHERCRVCGLEWLTAFAEAQ